ncbi:hypothetical protein ACFR9U_14160 [Halorientalis brevis]|uniref:Uncharacterized protein n=1 Tax=Halorientalis brevis TaxID=1126241 RepID=A0ABD6CFL1_9EURY|nr:hypothetical protein [Halorientalis brevis]
MADTNDIYYLLSAPFDADAQETLVSALTDSEHFSLIAPDRIERSAASGALELQMEYDSLFVRAQTGSPDGIPEMPALTLSVDAQSFSRTANSEAELDRNLDSLVALIKELYQILREQVSQPLYVIAASNSETVHVRQNDDHIARTTADGVREGKLEQVYWGQLFSPSMVSSIGEETITSAPINELDILADGSIFFSHHPNPNYGEKPYNAIYQHFGIEN